MLLLRQANLFLQLAENVEKCLTSIKSSSFPLSGKESKLISFDSIQFRLVAGLNPNENDFESGCIKRIYSYIEGACYANTHVMYLVWDS